MLHSTRHGNCRFWTQDLLGTRWGALNTAPLAWYMFQSCCVNLFPSHFNFKVCAVLQLSGLAESNYYHSDYERYTHKKYLVKTIKISTIAALRALVNNFRPWWTSYENKTAARVSQTHKFNVLRALYITESNQYSNLATAYIYSIVQYLSLKNNIDK